MPFLLVFPIYYVAGLAVIGFAAARFDLKTTVRFWLLASFVWPALVVGAMVEEWGDFEMLPYFQKVFGGGKESKQ